MHTLSDIISQYPILTILSSFTSTLDLYHLSLASTECRIPIQRNFDTLKRNCLCDGLGLTLRHTFSGPYSIRKAASTWGKTRKLFTDEPIEVRLWKTVCDSAQALPCQKCDINICEECRYYPREEPHAHYPRRRPHLNSPGESENILCLCSKCDAKVEQDLKGRFLNTLCDCDIYRRWICWKCVREERELTRQYYQDHTAWESELEETKTMEDHQFTRDFYCLCGANVPQNTTPRCSWCKRRHLPEDEWYREYQEVGSKMPFFDDDPCRAPYIGDIYAECCERPYPKLAYDGPIWKSLQNKTSPQAI